MSYFVVFIFMLLLGVDLAYLFKRGFGQTAAVSNFILIFMLYLGGLLADMRSAMYAFLIFVILLTGYTGFSAVRGGGGITLKRIKTVIFNPALYFYAAVGFMAGIIFANNVSLEFDEMTHWAISVKNMFEYDNFGNIGNTTTMFNQYVPATGIFGYAFQIFGNRFSNGHLFATMDLLITSMILPLSEKFSKKSSICGVVTMTLVFFVPILFKYNIFAALQVDALLGVGLAYIYLAYTVDRGRVDGFTIVNISLACFVMTLIKSAGIAHAIFALLLIAVDILTRRKAEMKSFFADRMNIVFVLLPAVLMAFAKLSWSWYVDFYEVRAGWNIGEMNLPNIIAWLQSPNEYQRIVTERFFDMFLKCEFIYVNNTCLQQPQSFFISAVIAACIALGFITKNARFAISQGATMLVIIIGYAMSLLLMYLFSFSYWEGLSLSEYSRYSGTIYIGLSLILYYQFAETVSVPMSEKESLPVVVAGIKYAVYAAISVALISVYTVYGCRICSERSEGRYGYFAPWLSAISDLDKSDSVYIVVNRQDKGFWWSIEIYLTMRFFATPMQTSGYLEGGSYENGRESDSSWTGNPFDINMPREEFLDDAANYTHIYMYDVWDEFSDKYGDLFEDEIRWNTLYRVNLSDDGNMSFSSA